MADKKPKHKLYWTDPDSGEVVIVIFDALTTITPEDTVDITEHPVEVGADVTDHARSNAGRLTLEGIVGLGPSVNVDIDANTQYATFSGDFRVPDAAYKTFSLNIPTPPLQLSESGLIQGGIAALKRGIFGAPTATVIGPTTTSFRILQGQVLQRDAGVNRVRDIYDTLLKVKDQHALITIMTTHRDHFDMMIERIAEPRTVNEGTSAKFQIDFRQVRTVSSSEVQAPKPDPAEQRAQPTVRHGSRGGKNWAALNPPASLVKQAQNYFTSVARPAPIETVTDETGGGT